MTSSHPSNIGNPAADAGESVWRKENENLFRKIREIAASSESYKAGEHWMNSSRIIEKGDEMLIALDELAAKQKERLRQLDELKESGIKALENRRGEIEDLDSRYEAQQSRLNRISQDAEEAARNLQARNSEIEDLTLELGKLREQQDLANRELTQTHNRTRVTVEKLETREKAVANREIVVSNQEQASRIHDTDLTTRENNLDRRIRDEGVAFTTVVNNRLDAEKELRNTRDEIKTVQNRSKARTKAADEQIRIKTEELIAREATLIEDRQHLENDRNLCEEAKLKLTADQDELQKAQKANQSWSARLLARQDQQGNYERLTGEEVEAKRRAEARVVVLEKEKQTLDETLADLQSRLSASEKTKESVEDRIEQMQAELGGKTEEASKLRARAEEDKKELGDIRLRYDESSTVNGRLQEQIDNLTIKADGLVRLLEESRQETATAKTEAERLTTVVLPAKETDLNDARIALEKLRATGRVTEEHPLVVQLRADLTKLRIEKESLDQRIESAKKLQTTSNALDQQRRRQISDLEIAKHALKEDAVEFKSTIAELETKILGHTAQKVKDDKDVGQLVEQNDILEAENSALKTDAVKLKSTITGLETEVEDFGRFEAEYQELDDLCSGLKEQRDRLSDGKRALQTQYDTLYQEAQFTTRDKDREIARLKEELEGLRLNASRHPPASSALGSRNTAKGKGPVGGSRKRTYDEVAPPAEAAQDDYDRPFRPASKRLATSNDNAVSEDTFESEPEPTAEQLRDLGLVSDDDTAAVASRPTSHGVPVSRRAEQTAPPREPVTTSWRVDVFRAQGFVVAGIPAKVIAKVFEQMAAWDEKKPEWAESSIRRCAASIVAKKGTSGTKRGFGHACKTCTDKQAVCVAVVNNTIELLPVKRPLSGRVGDDFGTMDEGYWVNGGLP
jgi:chromosome segregation ATPase